MEQKTLKTEKYFLMLEKTELKEGDYFVIFDDETFEAMVLKNKTVETNEGKRLLNQTYNVDEKVVMYHPIGDAPPLVGVPVYKRN